MSASTPLADVEWEACPIQPRRDPELESYLRERIGRVPEVAGYFSNCPWVGRGLADSFFQMGMLAHIEPRLAELIMLVVSQDASCRYCYAAQRALLRIQGFPAVRIRELEQDLHSAQIEPPARLALEFARRISRARPLPGRSEVAALRDAGYSQYAVCELAAVAAFSVFANRNSTLLAVPLGSIEGFSERWYVRLARPLMARRLRSLASRAEPVRLSATDAAGPFASLVLACDGLPLARTLRQTIDAALDSEILPRRAKAVVLAVVARALGSGHAEREARSLLASQGLASDSIEELLRHLSSQELDPSETELAQIARESVWYRPVQVQRRVQALAEKLPPAALVEAVGVAGLANAIARLDFLVDIGE